MDLLVVESRAECPADYTIVNKDLRSRLIGTRALAAPCKFTALTRTAAADAAAALARSSGSTAFLCFRVARRRDQFGAAFPARLLSRFPERDYADCPLDEAGVATMCFPQGPQLLDAPQHPSHFAFVLTRASGAELYCVALRFYEPVPDAVRTQILRDEVGGHRDARVSAAACGLAQSLSLSLSLARARPRPHSFARSRQSGEASLYWPKCLCVVSHWPLYSAFALFLKHLFQISLSPGAPPVERFIAEFACSVPLPPEAGPALTLLMGHAKIPLVRPSSFFLPPRDFSFRPLFQTLTVRNVCAVVAHMLSERKLVLFSNDTALLTPVAEALRTLVFPLQWRFAFVPVLPSRLGSIFQVRRHPCARASPRL
jgi:hypothetical protein